MSVKIQHRTESQTSAASPDTVALTAQLRAHGKLLKLGLNALVLATTLVGYLLASSGRPLNPPLLAWTLLGTLLAAWGASAVNQWLERSRDARMVRTRARPLPTGVLEPSYAFLLGVVLMASGDLLLTLMVNPLTGFLALLTQLIYLVAYTPLKTRSTLNTLVGAITGSIPPLMGYSAFAGRLDSSAWLLAGILFAWQIPHFLALAWMYREDYAHGGYVMLPASDKCGNLTFTMSLGYSLLLIPLGLGLTLTGATGWLSAATSVLLGGFLMITANSALRSRSYQSARRLFLASVIYLPLLLTVIAIDRRDVSPPAALERKLEASPGELRPASSSNAHQSGTETSMNVISTMWQ
jgi:protoheme IX farnesyltransferase